MKRIILLVIALTGCGFAAQDITVSNDTLGDDFFDVYFFCTSSVAISLDSAFIVIDSMDTTGSAGYVRNDSLQILWRENIETPDSYYWDLRKCDSNRFRLIRRDSSTAYEQPLSFSAQVPERRIVMLDFGLGGCLRGCSGAQRWLTPFFRGALVFHFSNGQTITLWLYWGKSGTTSLRYIPDRQPLPGFTAGPVVHEGNFVAITYGPTDDRARRIGIFDISGRVTATINLPAARHAAETVQLNTAGFPAGWYCVRTISGVSKEIIGSFIIDR